MYQLRRYWFNERRNNYNMLVDQTCTLHWHYVVTSDTYVPSKSTCCWLIHCRRRAILVLILSADSKATPIQQHTMDHYDRIALSAATAATHKNRKISLSPLCCYVFSSWCFHYLLLSLSASSHRRVHFMTWIPIHKKGLQIGQRQHRICSEGIPGSFTYVVLLSDGW